MQIAEATLQEATPLHCAALRGNPAQADHLLYCHADATITSASGLLALELVPPCGDRDADRARICRCMNAQDELVWECRSRGTREMIMQSMLSTFRGGLQQWLRLSVNVCRCWLGFWGMSKTLLRPQLEDYLAAKRMSRSHVQRAMALQSVAEVRQGITQARLSITKATHHLVHILSERNLPEPPPKVGMMAPSQLGGLPGRGGRAAHPIVDVLDSEDVLKEYAEAFAAADAALDGFFDGVKAMTQLTGNGFLMRPQQLADALRHQQDSIKGVASATAAVELP
jgi:hypothetical protein